MIGLHGRRILELSFFFSYFLLVKERVFSYDNTWNGFSIHSILFLGRETGLELDIIFCIYTP